MPQVSSLDDNGYGLSSRVIDIPVNQICDVANLARNDPAVIKLWIGEGDLPTPAFITQACVSALQAGLTRYTYALGLEELRQALVSYHQRHWNVTVAAERFSATVGGMNAIMQALQGIIEHGDEVIIPSPAWPNSTEVVNLLGGRSVAVGYDFADDGTIALNLEKLFAAVTVKTKAVMINSPSNPTGWIMPYSDMIRLRDFCRERGIWIVSDEVYNHFVYNDDAKVAPSFLQVCAPSDRLLVTNTFSKNWCMTGWRAGWVIYPEGLSQVFDNLSQYNTTCVPPFIQTACIEALNHGDAFIAEQVARCAVSRRILCEGLSQSPNVTVSAPEGTFYLLFKVEGVTDGHQMAIRTLREAKVGIAPGSAFGPGGAAYMRICFAIAPELAHAAVERLLPFLKSLRTAQEGGAQ